MPAATIGVVRLAVQMHAAWTSMVAMPAWTPATEPTDFLFVALRIDTLKSVAIWYFDTLSYHPVRVVGFYYRAAVGLKKSIYMTIAEKIYLAKSSINLFMDIYR